ncbi:MAG: 2-isopropylmalate synthase [Halobacteriota archaeon]|nr:2-isopropylmalate synthase [Halobacteriota archaeon]
MVFYTIDLSGKTVNIFDTTLRDGEQSPGISFTDEEKILIARQLDKLGVDVIEAGTPVVSREEKESVKIIASEDLGSKICGLARILKPDIDACIDCDVDLVHLFVSTSDLQINHTIKMDKEDIIVKTGECIEYVKDHGLGCLFSAMDATRSDLDYLIKIFNAAEEAGTDTINIPDTVGVMMPTSMKALVSPIYESVGVPIDVHCHNDFGLAVANSLAAVEAGARQVQVTVNGIGERAGNADLAEVVMSLHSIYGAKTKIKTEYLVETAKLLERLTGLRILLNKPIVGANAFSHESGIHAHGVIERSDTFEPGIMTPEMVGHKRRIVLGKHAGKHSVKQRLGEIGLSASPDQLDEILTKVKELGVKGKEVTDEDLHAIAEVVIGEVSKEKQLIVLEEVSVMTGNKVTSTATVKAIVGGEERTGSHTGVGPVDAALKAVQAIITEFAVIRLTDFRIDAITGGSNALAEVLIGVEDEGGRVITARGASDDIVMASVEALVNAINRLMVGKG